MSFLAVQRKVTIFSQYDTRGNLGVYLNGSEEDNYHYDLKEFLDFYFNYYDYYDFEAEEYGFNDVQHWINTKIKLFAMFNSGELKTIQNLYDYMELPNTEYFKFEFDYLWDEAIKFKTKKVAEKFIITKNDKIIWERGFGSIYELRLSKDSQEWIRSKIKDPKEDYILDFRAIIEYDNGEKRLETEDEVKTRLGI